MDRLEYIRIVDTYANTAYRIAYSYCKNKSDAEDVVQNVFLKLLQSDVQFQDEEHIRKWLIKVTANHTKNLCKSFWKKKIIPLEDFDVTPQYQFKTKETSELYGAVMELPYKYRIVVHLYYYEDYSVKEIAKILNIKETTVQTQLMRARKKLKIKLKEVWQNE